MNYDKNDNPFTNNYFEKRVPEEDYPLKLDHEIHSKYENLEIIYDQLFDENSQHVAKQFSKDERDKRGLNESSFVYGEITFRSFCYIFEYVKSKIGNIRHGSFIDLGSGIGKGVLAAAFIQKFDKYIGVEYLENLHNIALEMKVKLEENYEEIYKTYKDYLPLFESCPNVHFLNGDFLKEDWNDVSFLFANSTCFSPDLMQALSNKAEELSEGTIFVTFTKKLPNLSDNWEYLEGFRRLMSWGIATIYIHRKIK